MALEKKYKNKVNFIIADVDDPQGQELAGQYQVDTIPAFFLLDKDGFQAASFVGARSFDEIDANIKSYLFNEKVEKKESFSNKIENFFTQTLPEAMEDVSIITFILVFLGGLLTSFSPCVLSMIPLMVGYVGGYAEKSKTKGFILSLSFVIGLGVTFAILGIAAALLGRIFGNVGRGWYYIVAAVAIIMGLNLMGILKFNFPTLKKMPIKGDGFLGPFLMGMLFGLVASPCATPVLAVLITYVASQGNLWFGALFLFIYGLGHGVPLLVAGTFTAALKKLPKIQKWSGYITTVSGVILILVGIYFLIQAIK